MDSYARPQSFRTSPAELRCGTVPLSGCYDRWVGEGGKTQGNSREGLQPPRGQEEPTQVPKAAAILPSKTDSVQIKPASKLQLSFHSEGC